MLCFVGVSHWIVFMYSLYDCIHAMRQSIYFGIFHNVCFYICRLRAESPEALKRTVEPQEAEEIKAFLQSRMPSLCGDVVDTLVCMYTKTVDEHL